MKRISCIKFVFALLMTAMISTLSFASNTEETPEKALRMAILMPAPAKLIHSNWQALADYLTVKMGQPVKIVTPRGLEETKKTLPEVDFVYANSYLYSILSQDFKIAAIAQMKNTGQSVYSQGKFLVRNDSSIKSAKDLKGKKIALISPYGAGSYLAPRAYLKKHGLDIDKDVQVEFTNNLKKAAYMVMLGEADTAVMCEVNYEILSKKIDTGDLRFFDKTEAFPEAVMFTLRDPQSDIVKRFQQALVDVNDDKAAAMKSLHGMKIGTFIPYDTEVEGRIRELSKEAGLKYSPL